MYCININPDPNNKSAELASFGSSYFMRNSDVFRYNWARGLAGSD